MTLHETAAQIPTLQSSLPGSDDYENLSAAGVWLIFPIQGVIFRIMTATRQRSGEGRWLE